METLKRDWDSKLTLRDVLVTISCLLIQPNPDSALNAEAGALIQEDFEAFARRAELMTAIHAGVPREMRELVKQAQCRGQEDTQEMADAQRGSNTGSLLDARGRRRGPTARHRGTVRSRRSDGSPSGAGYGRGRVHAGPSRPPAPFVVQTSRDDVFGDSFALHEDVTTQLSAGDDSSMLDADQENDESKSPTKAKAPAAMSTPRRPQGAAVPLGELTMDDAHSDTSENSIEMEAEYPPSPRKSPRKSPVKQRRRQSSNDGQAESSRAALFHAQPTITPPNNPAVKPLAEDSPFATLSASPWKNRELFRPVTPGSVPKKTTALFDATPQTHIQSVSIFKTRSPSSSEKKRRKEELDAKLWELCGRDIKRWNKGDFGEGVFKVKAKRW